jgi:tetratricopeptide (TPR) repeat protein
MRKKTVFGCLLCWIISCHFVAFSQPNPKERDTLQQKYDLAKTDSARIMILTEFAWLYRKFDKPKALNYCEQAAQLAEKINFVEGIGFANMAVGNVYNYHTEHNVAIIFYKKAIPYFQKIQYEEVKNHRLGQLYYNLGEAYRASNLQQEAISSLNEATEFYKKANNKRNLPSIYIEIANIYESQKQYTESLRYADKALSETNRMKDTITFCNVMNDLNNVYLSLHTQTKNPLYLSKAKKNFYLVYQILVKTPKYDPNGIVLPTILTNLGDCLLREAKYDSASYFLNESNRLAIKIQYTWIQGYNAMYLGEIALNKQQIIVADVQFQKALLYQKKYGDSFTIELNLKMVKLETIKGNFEKALFYQQIYQKDYEKISNTEKNRAINEIQTRYETRQKETKIIDLQKDNIVKYQQLLGTIILAILSLALAITIFIVYRSQRKIFRQKEQLLNEENKKVILEKELEGKAKEKAILQNQLAENENQRMQEEIQLQSTIHTLQQEQLQIQIDFKQRELTTNVMQLEKKNGLLVQLKKQLQEIENKPDEIMSTIRKFNKLIDSSLDIEEDIDKFTAHFENVHPQFFQNLHKHAVQLLSALDLKYCAYIRMHLSTKEIANLLGIEPKSVRMAQYRLKKKLQLSEDEDLKEFLNQL